MAKISRKPGHNDTVWEKIRQERILPLIRYKMRAYYSKQRKSNPYHKEIRSALHQILMRIRRIKEYQIEKRTRLSKKDRRFKKDIEAKFLPEMCWENYGKFAGGWKIGFEVPLKSAKSKYEIKKYSRNVNIIPVWPISVKKT